MILNQQYEQKEYPTTICSLRGLNVDNVTAYRYLGCEVKYNEPCTGETELNLRSDTAECKFYSLARNMFNRKIRLKTRITMLNSLVRSRLVYACQTWCVTRVQLNRINSFYTSFIRKMVNGGYKRKDNTWHFVLTNENLLSMANTIDLSTFIGKQQRSYVGKIIRKDNQSIVKRLLFNNDYSRKPGRQLTLLSNVLNDLQCDMKDLMKSAMNGTI